MILALLLAGSEPPWNCADPQAQQEMNWCAAKEFEAADAELNAQWKLTAAAMKERDGDIDRTYDKRSGYFETLLAAQRAWLSYRGQHCASEGYLFRGGSMEALLVGTCKTKLTRERTQQLRFLIEQ